MSEIDDVPTLEQLAGDSEAEVEEWLLDTFDDLARSAREAPFHNRSGFLCYLAGDPQCLELGHTYDEADDVWEPEGDHEHWDWNGNGRLCSPTRYQSACGECESAFGECEGGRRLDVQLWALPGVTGADRG